MNLRKTHEQYVKEVERKNNKVIIIGTYSGATNYIKAKCKRCGNEWDAKAYSLLSGRACPKCKPLRGIENNKGKTRKKSHNQFLKELNKVDKSIIVKSKYKSHHDCVKCLCKRCGNEWEAMAYSLLQGHGCPRCAKSGTSFMEQFIRLSFVKKLSKEAVLSRDKKTIGMELDIVIPKYKIAIEPGNWQLHKKSINRDKKKRERCLEKGIKLITIYDRFPSNESIPFNDNCIVNENDYNNSDHSEIQSLVKKLFTICDIKCNFTDADWNEIETNSYKLAKAKTHQDFIKEMEIIHPNIHVIGKYENANRRIKVRCKECGYEWNGVPANMLSGDGCRKCGFKRAHEKRIKDGSLVKRKIEEANPDIEVIGEYKGRHLPLKARCKICGYEWSPTAASLLRGSNHKGSRKIHKMCKK